MDSVCFHLFGRPVYWYGLFVAAAFLAGILHLTLLARRERRPAAFVSDLGFWIMVAGILGARLAYVLANPGLYRENAWLILRIDQGGLIFYGGLVGAALAVCAFAHRRRLPLAELADFVITALPLGQAIGRIGCFVNPCCYGKPGGWPWCVTMADAVRHPTQLYESAACLAIYGLLLLAYRRPKRRPGSIMALYLVLYPAARFILEFWRGDERLRWGCLTAAQAVSLALAAAGLLMLWGLRSRRGTDPRP